MKTIKVINGISPELKPINIGTILRVNDKAAREFVNAGEAEFVPKHVWKEQENKLNQQKGDINGKK